MNAQKISSFLGKTGAVASLLAASAALTGSLAPSASAVTLLPPTNLGINGEAEINVGLGCLSSNCVAPTDIPLIANIESLVDASSGNKSRLFIDNLLTPTNYDGGSLGKAIFLKKDAGTNPSGFWFRPSETNANGSVGEEKGQLEVGTYKITFASLLSELTIRYFDTESRNSTGVPNFGGILKTDGTLVTGNNPVLPGSNGNIQYQTWKNVKSITLKLGNDIPNGTGDGVDFQLEATQAVPEPTALAGLGLVAGAMAVSRRRKITKSS
ncbi:MAG TPA: LEVG family PEP-CTERM protein [Cyanophyceae cyanobacterium]